MSGLSAVLFISLGLLLLYVQLIMSTEVIPERAEVYDVNEKYANNVFAYIRRTGRRSPYYFNVGVTTLDWFGDNVTVHAVFYEYLHNEYKRSFVQVDINGCDILKKEPYRTVFGTILKARGISCPVPPGKYEFYNMSLSLASLPYVWPFEKAMVEGYAKLTTTQEILGRARYYVTLKRDIPKRY